MPARRGSALVAVFWLIAVLGLIVFAAIQLVSTDAGVAASIKNAEQARRMAEKGLAIGTHPEVEKYDPVLAFENGSGWGYRVKIGFEESRLGINAVLKAGQKEVLRRLFLSWGAGDELASVAVDSLVDWVDDDGVSGLFGAEAEWYANMGMLGFPRNRAFRSESEILLVRGMREIAALRPGWRSAISLWGDGKVDVNGAGADVIASVAGVPLGRAETLLSVRSGYDGIDGSEDDILFEDLSRAAQILGIAPQIAGAFFVTEGVTERIESLGYAGNARQKLVLVKREGAVLWSGAEIDSDEEANL